MTFLRGAPSDATPGTSIETKCGLAETEFQRKAEVNKTKVREMITRHGRLGILADLKRTQKYIKIINRFPF